MPYWNNRRRLRRNARRKFGLWVNLPWLCAVAGCGSGADRTRLSVSLVDGNQDESLTSPLGKTSGEPNNAFTEPIVAVFDEFGVARLKGMVAATGDLMILLSNWGPCG